MNPFWIILITSVILKLVIAASTFHPDIRLLNIGGIFISNGNIFSLYDVLAGLPNSHFLRQAYPVDLLIYPPAIFFLHGIFNFFFSPFVDQGLVNVFLVNVDKVLGNPGLNLHLLLLKLPYLLFDIPAAFLLARLFDSKRMQLLAFTLWSFNPVNLYATYMMGQFDITPTFFVILALFIVKKGITKFGLSTLELTSLSLGLGAVFKIYPFYLLAPLAGLENGWGKRIKIIFLGTIPYFLTILPFFPSHGFRTSALIAGHTLKSFYATVGISGGESIILFLATLIFFYLLFWQKRQEVQFIWQNFFITLLLFFIFTHYHPQWFLWLTPFLIIDLLRSEFRHLSLTLLSLFSFTSLLFFFEPSLTVGLFSPLFPSLYNQPGVWQLLGLKLDYNLMRSFFQTIFAGTALYFIYYNFPKSSEQ